MWSHIFQWCDTRQIAGALTRVSRKFLALARRPQSWHTVHLPFNGALAKRFMRFFSGVGRRAAAVAAHTDSTCDLETLLRYLCFPRSDGAASDVVVADTTAGAAAAIAFIEPDRDGGGGGGGGDGDGSSNDDTRGASERDDDEQSFQTAAAVAAAAFDAFATGRRPKFRRRAPVARVIADRNRDTHLRTGWAARAATMLAPNLALRALTLHIASLTSTWASDADAAAFTGVIATLFPRLETLRLTIGTSEYPLDLQHLLDSLAHLRDLQVRVPQHKLPLCATYVALPLRMVRYREIGCRTAASITKRRSFGLRSSSSSSLSSSSSQDAQQPEETLADCDRKTLGSGADTTPTTPSSLTVLQLCHGALLPQIEPLGDGGAYFDCTLEISWLAANLPRLAHVVYRDSHATTSHSTRWCGALARHPSITQLDVDQLPRPPFSTADTLAFLGSPSDGGDGVTGSNSDESTPEAWRWPTRSNMRRLSVARAPVSFFSLLRPPPSTLALKSQTAVCVRVCVCVCARARAQTLDFMRSYTHLREIRFRDPNDFDTRGAIVYGHRSSKIHEVLVALARSATAVAGHLKYVGLPVHDAAAIAAPFRETLGGVVITATDGDGMLEANGMWPNLDGRHTYRERHQLLREGARDIECDIGGSKIRPPARSSTVHVFAWMRGELVPSSHSAPDVRLFRPNVVLVPHSQSHDSNLHVSRPRRFVPDQQQQAAYRVGVSVRDPSLVRLLGGGCVVEFSTGEPAGLAASGMPLGGLAEVEFDVSAPRLTATCRAVGGDRKRLVCYCRGSPRVWQCEDRAPLAKLGPSSSSSPATAVASPPSSSSPSSSSPQPHLPAVSSVAPPSCAVFSTPLSIGSPPRMWSVFIDDIFRYTVDGIVAPPPPASPPRPTPLT